MANHPHNSKRPESASVVRALEIGDVAAVRDALSPRQRRFAEEYILDYNGSAAAVRAGYSPKSPDKQAYLLLRHKGIAFLIDDLLRSKEAKIMSVNPEYVIQEVIGIIRKEGSKDGDKLRGLELLARHLGMFIDRTEITGKDGGPLAIEEQKAKEEADSFLAELRALQERADAVEKKDVVIFDD